MGNRFKTLILISLLIGGMFITACSDSVTNNPIVENNDPRVTEINKVCDSLLKANPDMTGIIVGIWDSQNQINYSKGFGVADLQSGNPVGPNMLFRVGSITKTFTTTLLLQLVDAGKLRLEDSVTKYFPEYKQLEGVTIDMLCNMSSGVFDYVNDSSFTNLLLANMSKYMPPDEIMKLALRNNILSVPGTEFHYSSSNTILLGMIIEKITTREIENLIQDSIIAPAGLTNTYFPTVKEMPIRKFLHGYYLGLDLSEQIHPSWAWAAGGMVSNIDDLKKWTQILVRGDLLSPTLHNKRFIGFSDNESNTYGLGISTIGDNLWGHSGTVPGYESIMMTDIAGGRTFVIAFNTYSDKISPAVLLKRILAVLK